MRGVQTLDEAIAAVESLKDYSTQDKGKKPNSTKSGGGPKRNSNKGKESGYQKYSSANSKQEKGSSNKNKAASKPPKPCFICDGPH